jgi:hypothetical protein
MGLNARRNEAIARDAKQEEREGRLSNALGDFAGQFARGMVEQAPLITSTLSAASQSRGAPQAAAAGVQSALGGGSVTSCPVGFHLFMPYGRAGVCQPNAVGSGASRGTNQSTITGH